MALGSRELVKRLSFRCWRRWCCWWWWVVPTVCTGADDFDSLEYFAGNKCDCFGQRQQHRAGLGRPGLALFIFMLFGINTSLLKLRSTLHKPRRQSISIFKPFTAKTTFLINRSGLPGAAPRQTGRGRDVVAVLASGLTPRSPLASCAFFHYLCHLFYFCHSTARLNERQIASELRPCCPFSSSGVILVAFSSSTMMNFYCPSGRA